jgi:hypothetical protein
MTNDTEFNDLKELITRAYKNNREYSFFGGHIKYPAGFIEKSCRPYVKHGYISQVFQAK